MIEIASAPLTPWQVDLWLAERLREPRTALQIPTHVAVPSALPPQRITAAIGDLARAYPLLSTVLDERDGVPLLVHRPGAVDVRTAADGAEALDLGQALLRVSVVASDRTTLVRFVAHHLIFDGVSQRLLVEGLAAALLGDVRGDGGAYFEYARSFSAAEQALSPAARARAAEATRRLAGRTASNHGGAGALRHATLHVQPAGYAVWRSIVTGAHSAAALPLAVALRALSACEPVPVLAITTDARPPEHAATMGTFTNLIPLFFTSAEGGASDAALAAAERELEAARALRAEPLWNTLPGPVRAAAFEVPAVTFRRFAPRVPASSGIRAYPFLPNAHAKRRLTMQIIEHDGAVAFRVEADAARVGADAFAAMLDALGEALGSFGIAYQARSPEEDA